MTVRQGTPVMIRKLQTFSARRVSYDFTFTDGRHA
jgi:hypothetical protein